MVEEEITCSMAAFFKVSWQTISSLKVSTIEICYQFISSVCVVFIFGRLEIRTVRERLEGQTGYGRVGVWVDSITGSYNFLFLVFDFLILEIY